MEVPLKFCSLSLSLSKAAGIGKIAHQSRTGRKRLAEIREEEKKSRMRNHFFAQYNIYIELLTLVVYFFSLWQKVTSNSLDHWFFFFQFFYLNSLPCVCVCFFICITARHKKVGESRLPVATIAPTFFSSSLFFPFFFLYISSQPTSSLFKLSLSVFLLAST